MGIEDTPIDSFARERVADQRLLKDWGVDEDVLPITDYEAAGRALRHDGGFDPLTNDLPVGAIMEWPTPDACSDRPPAE